MAVDSCFWIDQVKDFHENFGGVILVYNCYSEKSVCNSDQKKDSTTSIFENGWLLKAVSEQSKIATCNVIRFLTIKISFRILL